MSWPEKDLIAITIDGTLLVNARALDGVDLEDLVMRKDVFVGVRLHARESRLLRRRLAEAASEAAAYVSGGRRRRAR